mmetsp:Transcript_37775/g.82171  ORF Transcript_37775/g.82171 Transcript_37775/m.82171 type:complete len:174 (-) Transcript_37775:253-774(-)|eukprot:CAMPEP_0118932010 /NCGR_PEP_ID=MMETSP1169-20130426/8939_1 /TAXON_ID=36882 /ORGANISM="Pyramimonas obovata, Strain CCMP722" /LENGTH=173 /DNA_ID=CAMNT_0006874599 /DNA_START=100 /DNA_END=621 /DNA_ORIENTATION=-
MLCTSNVYVRTRRGSVCDAAFRVHVAPVAALHATRGARRGRRLIVTTASSSNEDGGFNYVKSMGFAGFGPETINGRSAMCGITAGLAAELATGDSFPTQLYEHPAAFALVVSLVTAATYFPSAQGLNSYNSNPDTLDIGLFTPHAERVNGRSAMIGIAIIMTLEMIKGGALFY